MFHTVLRRAALLSLTVALTLAAVSCSRNPVTGKRQLNLVSEQQEMQIGRQTDAEVVGMFGLYDESALTAYIDGIGQRMAALSHRPDLRYEFKILDSEVVNAFAVPGGYVYVTRGILTYFNSEAELAGVLGHEIGHITARHTASRMTRGMVTELGLGIGSAVSEEFAQMAQIAQAGAQLLFLRYSRDDERQSDQLGVEYASMAGYDTHEMANFFETLQRLNPGASGGLPSWFSTHPDPANRVDYIHRHTDEFRAERGIAANTIERERYLRAIEGMPVGKDPRRGFVEGNTYYHPELAFRFPVPRGWNVTNLADRVQIVAPGENAFLLLQLAGSGTPRSAADEFVRQSNASVVSRGDTTVSGLQAHRLQSTVGDLAVQSMFYSLDGRLIVIHGATREALTRYATDFNASQQGFARLTDSAKLNVQPSRLRIAPAPAAGTLRSALESLGIAQQRIEALAIVNGMQLGDRVERGYLLKLY